MALVLLEPSARRRGGGCHHARVPTAGRESEPTRGPKGWSGRQSWEAAVASAVLLGAEASGRKGSGGARLGCPQGGGTSLPRQWVGSLASLGEPGTRGRKAGAGCAGEAAGGRACGRRRSASGHRGRPLREGKGRAKGTGGRVTGRLRRRATSGKEVGPLPRPGARGRGPGTPRSLDAMSFRFPQATPSCVWRTRALPERSGMQ